MLRCIACDSIVSYNEDYCFECSEAIRTVYIEDSKYAAWLSGVHPDTIPLDFLSVNYAFMTDTN